MQFCKNKTGSVDYLQQPGRIWNIAPEDCVQEAVLRLVEPGGHARAGERRFQFYTCKHAMQAYITKYGGSNDLGDWRTNRQRYNDERHAEQRASGTSSPDTWRRSKHATEKIVRAIYEMGEGVNQAQLRRHLDISSGGVSKRVSIAIKEGLVENGGGITGCKGHALRITARGGPLSTLCRRRHNQQPRAFRPMGFRDIIAHHYFDIDAQLLPKFLDIMFFYADFRNRIMFPVSATFRQHNLPSFSAFGPILLCRQICR